jgi:hypothetical protein
MVIGECRDWRATTSMTIDRQLRRAILAIFVPFCVVFIVPRQSRPIRRFWQLAHR